jgi:hypothetical protein
MDVQDKVMDDFKRRVGKPIPITGTRTSGMYASKVRIKAPQGSAFDGLTGVVVRTHDDRTAFVRLRYRNAEITLPFGYGELEVLP